MSLDKLGETETDVAKMYILEVSRHRAVKSVPETRDDLSTALPNREQRL
jgi:hypothetical protein